MTELSPIRKLMVTAGRCALRAAPLDKEILEELRKILSDPALPMVAPDGQMQETGLLLVSAYSLVKYPDSQHALEAFQAARSLYAERRAAEARPGTPEAEPEFWWQRD